MLCVYMLLLYCRLCKQSACVDGNDCNYAFLVFVEIIDYWQMIQFESSKRGLVFPGTTQFSDLVLPLRCVCMSAGTWGAWPKTFYSTYVEFQYWKKRNKES